MVLIHLKKFAIEAFFFFFPFAYSSVVEKKIDNQIILKLRVPGPRLVQVYENYNVVIQPEK